MKRLSVWLALLLIGGLLATSMVGCGQKEESDQQLTKVRYCEVVRSILDVYKRQSRAWSGSVC